MSCTTPPTENKTLSSSKYFLTFLSLITIMFNAFSQEVTIADTRNTNELPAYFTNKVRFDFKYRTSLDVPGRDTYSTMMTIAPWSDASGDKNHQLNFNNGGIYYRTGVYGATSWEGWQKLVLEDNNGNVGIGTPNPHNRLEVSGSTFNRAAFVATEDAQTGIMIQRNQISGNHNTAWEIYSPASSTDLRLFSVSDLITFQTNGNVGIGTTDPKGYKLAVNGKIRTHEIKVETANWPDYVFAKDYKLPSIAETENHIKQKGHLPGIPSAAEVKKNGVDLGEMNAQLLRKIEELTLYIIDLKKENLKSNSSIDELRTLINKLEGKMDQISLKK